MMQAQEVLPRPSGALMDLTGSDLNTQKPPSPASGADGFASKAAPPRSAAHDAHRRSGRTRTVRVRDGFFDSSLLHYVSLDDPAAAALPQDALASARSPPALAKGSNRPTPKHTPEPWHDDDTPLGPDYQASIPAWCPRPAQPTAAEAKFLPPTPLYSTPDPADAAAVGGRLSSKTRAGRAGVTVPMPPVGVAASSSDFRYKYRWAKDGAGRRKLLHAAVNALDKQLGPNMVQVLGLEGLGFKRGQGWQPHEELLFCLGMCDKYRMFKYIRQCYLWSRSAHELNGYYHNVWKTRSTPEADEFLTLKEEEADREEFSAFFDKVRDKLVSMWDKKTMGDMPKLVKDMAAAAAAAATFPTKDRSKQAKDRNKQAELMSEDDDGSDSDSSSSDSDSDSNHSDSSRRAARSKQRQKKRPAAAAVASDAADKPPTKKAKNSSGAPADRQQQQQQQQQQPPLSQHQRRRLPRADVLEQQQHRQPDRPAKGTLTRPLRWHPAQQQYPRRQRSGRSLQQMPPLSQMPQLPRPNPQDQAAVASWLKALPSFRESLDDFLTNVNSSTDRAIQDHQRAISQLQRRRSSITAQAEAYIKALLAQGQELVANMTAAEAQPQPSPPHPPQHQQQTAVKQEAVAVAQSGGPAGGQEPLQQQPQQQQQEQQEQEQQEQQKQPPPAGDDAQHQCNGVCPDQQAAVQPGGSSQKGDSGTAEQQQGRQSPAQQQVLQKQQQGAEDDVEAEVEAADVVPHTKGPSCETSSICQQQQRQPRELETPKDSMQQQQDQQQERQPQELPQLDVKAGTDAPELPSPLPFPGGPLTKWLAPRLQANNAAESAVIKHIPRPYVKK